MNSPHVIDAHQHFWTFDPVEFGWLDDSMACLRRDHLPEELGELNRWAGVDGTVAVQARQGVGETEWLLALADDHLAIVRGVVGWLPLAEGASVVSPLLERHAGHPAFKGVRHVLQAEEDDHMFGSSFQEGLSAVAAFTAAVGRSKPSSG
jgi:L-fuconolactonase